VSRDLPEEVDKLSCPSVKRQRSARSDMTRPQSRWSESARIMAKLISIKGSFDRARGRPLFSPSRHPGNRRLHDPPYGGTGLCHARWLNETTPANGRRSGGVNLLPIGIVRPRSRAGVGSTPESASPTIGDMLTRRFLAGCLGRRAAGSQAGHTRVRGVFVPTRGLPRRSHGSPDDNCPPARCPRRWPTRGTEAGTCLWRRRT